MLRNWSPYDDSKHTLSQERRISQASSHLACVAAEIPTPAELDGLSRRNLQQAAHRIAEALGVQVSRFRVKTVLDVPIDELGLTRRVTNALKRTGIASSSQLALLLMAGGQVKGIGDAGRAEIETALIARQIVEVADGRNLPVPHSHPADVDTNDETPPV